MKAGLAGFLGFIFGAGVGAGVTYVVTKNILQKKNDAELAAMESYYKDKIPEKAPVKKETSETPRKATETPSEEAEMLKKVKQSTYERISPVKGPITDYAAKYKGTMRREDDDTDIQPEQGRGGEPLGSIEDELAREAQPMVIISPDEWEESGYDKREVTYYSDDEIFADEYNHDIPLEVLSPDDVGRANLEHFGITGEDGVLYCRDEYSKVDYKINLEDGSYYALIDDQE